MGQLASKSSLALFSISTPSRHPANQNGYDARNHRYRTDYVNPKFWVLNLDASPGLPKNPHGDVQVPNDVISFAWTVKQVDGPFAIHDHRTSSPMWKTEVGIPTPGEYQVTLQVNLTGGRREINTRSYRLRDFLIVSVGDSFAAGQGNPDVVAVPSIDETAICEATSFKLALTKISDAVNKFRKKLEQETKEAIEDYLPYAGKIVVATLNEVEDVAGFVKGGVEGLNDAAVEVVKDVVGGFVEGAEEIGGWLGFGDGGEAKQTRSAGWQEPNAYRSYRSGHSLAARQIETESETGADRVTFLSFARSGSDIWEGLLGPRTVDHQAIDGWTGNRGQIQEAKDTVLNRPIDALLITIGVNDLGFSSLVEASIIQSSASDRQNLIRKTEKKLKEQLAANFDVLKHAIDSQLKPQQVFILEYPAGLFTKLNENNHVSDAGPCGVLGSSIGYNLNLEDGKTLRRLGKLMNAIIRTKAGQFGWAFIDGIEQGFDGHGYCASKSYFVFAEESCRNQGDFEGMLHPNKRGHTVARDCIVRALRRELLTPHAGWLEPVLNVMMH